MKRAKLLFLLIAALAFAPCGSDEPRYADPEAHEKTYSNIATFDYADETTFRFEGFYFKDKDGWITFLRGEAE